MPFICLENTMKKFIFALSTLMLLSACQSTPKSTLPVVARADNTLETTGLGKTKHIAKNNALTNAQAQCGNKQVVILKDSTNYDGVIDERTGRLIDQGVAIMGAVIGTKTPTLARDDDYEYTISFRCQ